MEIWPKTSQDALALPVQERFGTVETIRDGRRVSIPFMALNSNARCIAEDDVITTWDADGLAYGIGQTADGELCRYRTPALDR